MSKRVPKWFKQLIWNGPYSLESLKGKMLPNDQIGCYVFTHHHGALAPGNGVLYVGETSGKTMSLHKRTRTYLRDFSFDPNAPKKQHKGKAFIFEARKNYGDSGLFLHWTVYGDPLGIEGPLIDYLEPECNSTYGAEDLDDNELLDPVFIGGPAPPR